jgi:hypothetical protein
MTSEERNWTPTPVNKLVVRPVNDELLIYDTTSNKAHCLNQSMSSVWNLCDGNNNVQDILNRLRKTNRMMNTDSVGLALKDLVGRGLLQDNMPEKAEWKRMSRRVVIRRIGSTAAAIGIPVIASIMVPTAAEAASCFTLGHICSTNSQCCSGHCGLAGIKLVCL